MDIKGRICLKAVFNETQPHVIVRIDDDVIYQGFIDEEHYIDFSQDIDAGKHKLIIDFDNKVLTDRDIAQALDMAVVVDHIEFFGITSQKFVWNGLYDPIYPEPWASEQREKGITLRPRLTACNYLGWNGRWSLAFTAPIFTWIHQVEELGWIYN